MVIRNIVDRQDAVARVIAEGEVERHAAAALAAVGVEGGQELLRGLGVDGGARALREGADVAVAVHLLARAGGAAAGVAEGGVEDVLQGAVEAVGRSAAVDAEGAGGEVRGRVADHTFPTLPALIIRIPKCLKVLEIGARCHDTGSSPPT